jgi:RimJ/RimL family protein N-acetyltransferase
MEDIFNELKLQELTSKDVKAFFEMMNNNRHLLARYFPLTVDNTRTLLGTEYFVQSLLRKRENNEYVIMTIKHKDKMIGVFYIKNIDWKIPKCELTYFIDHTYQGKGLMTKLFKKIIDLCFLEFKMNKIYVKISPDNATARVVAAKLGFKTEGILRKEFKTETGELVDLEYLGMVNPAIDN